MERPCSPEIKRRTLERGLYLVLTEPRDGYAQLAEWAVISGLPAVQLRYKGPDDRRHLALARELRGITSGSSTLFIVNDRPDIAIMASADGVHLGQGDLPPDAVRCLIGQDLLLGWSTHNLHQLAAAETLPVDYIGFGPLYPTDSKRHPDPVTGPQSLTAAHGLSRHPIVAIGGLNRERIAALDAHLCRNVAVIKAVSEAPDPLAAMQTLHTVFMEHG